MKILSNDHAENIPGSKKMTTGGATNFGSLLNESVLRNGHQWTGVIAKRTKQEKTRITKIGNMPTNRSLLSVYLPTKYKESIVTGKNETPEKTYREAIDCLTDVFKKESPDLVFLNGFGIFQWLLMKAANNLDIPVVLQHAGIWYKEASMYKHLYSQKILNVFRKIENDTTQSVSKHVFLNTHSKRAFTHLYGKKISGTSVTIPLPYNPLYISKKKKASRKVKKIGMVARWDRVKNHEGYLELAMWAKKAGLPWEFYSVTTVPPTSKYKEFKNNFRKYIHVEKPKNQKALRKFYQDMDLMILPSHFETAGFVVMEAALSGTATLISPEVGWVDEYTQSDMKQWVISFKDPNAVTERIEKIISLPPKSAFIKHLKNEHSPRKVFSEYMDVFTQAIKSKQK